MTGKQWYKREAFWLVFDKAIETEKARKKPAEEVADRIAEIVGAALKAGEQAAALGNDDDGWY